jgi:hypothetical protein
MKIEKEKQKEKVAEKHTMKEERVEVNLQEETEAKLEKRADISDIRFFLFSPSYIASPADANVKPLLGSAETLSAMQDFVFNWRTWPNFDNNGSSPILNR